MPFGWWIPVLITAVTLPRLYLRIRYGTAEWSVYGSGAPQVRKLWYLSWLLSTTEAIKEMRVFQSHGSLTSKFETFQNELLQLHKKPLDNYLRQLSYPPILETAVLFAIAYTQLPNVLTGVLTIGSFTLLINMIEQLNGNASGAVINFGDMYEHNLFVDHYFEVLELPKLITESKSPTVFKKISPPMIIYYVFK